MDGEFEIMRFGQSFCMVYCGEMTFCFHNICDKKLIVDDKGFEMMICCFEW